MMNHTLLRSANYVGSSGVLRCSLCRGTGQPAVSPAIILKPRRAAGLKANIRAYATEANVIPQSVLIRSPPPPSPTTQAGPPESATSLHRLPTSAPSTSSLHDVDALLHSFHERVFVNGTECARLPVLYDQLSSQAGRMVDYELPYEDTPPEHRRVKTTDATPLADQGSSTRHPTWFESCKLAERKLASSTDSPRQDIPEDGLVLVAHVVESSPSPITSWSLGFVVSAKQDHRGRAPQYVISCSHTLESAMHAYRSTNSSRSSTFVMTRSGALMPVTGIASSLPLHDIVLYNFGKESVSEALQCVPVALHPPQPGVEQSMFSVGDEKWKRTKVIGYKDPRGNDAEPGTYDELNSISIDVLPTPGSSGGPLISPNGAVTALIRGSRMAYGERGSVGFATPAEKIFEMFQLPGLKRST